MHIPVYALTNFSPSEYEITQPTLYVQPKHNLVLDMEMLFPSMMDNYIGEDNWCTFSYLVTESGLLVVNSEMESRFGAIRMLADLSQDKRWAATIEVVKSSLAGGLVDIASSAGITTAPNVDDGASAQKSISKMIGAIDPAKHPYVLKVLSNVNYAIQYTSNYPFSSYYGEFEYWGALDFSGPVLSFSGPPDDEERAIVCWDVHV